METAFLSSARSCFAVIKFNCMYTNFISVSYFHFRKKKKGGGGDSNLCEHAFSFGKVSFFCLF